ncbi:hypothetical protein HK102_001913 [Quaeritorhiza haematococci]|nr:hypothetical protein HK102_001913 [Quaeritorhiza haematococci]
MTETQPKPKTVLPLVPGPHNLPHNEHILYHYIRIVKSWNTLSSDSLRPLTRLDRIELRLFRLFFFDALEALPHFPTAFEYYPNAHDLKLKANYVAHSLLSLSENADRLPGSEPPKGSSHSSPSSQQPDLEDDNLDLISTTNSTGADEQQHLTKSVSIGSITQRNSQKQLRSPSPLRLPPELLSCVLQHLDALIVSALDKRVVGLIHQCRYSSLAQCALVNRDWHKATVSLLWKNVQLYSPLSQFRFLRGLQTLNSTDVVLTSSQLGDWVGTRIVKLTLTCTDRATTWDPVQHWTDPLSIWRTFAQNLFLFPQLRHLTLERLPNSHGLSLLFDQDLPSLEHLAINVKSGYLCDGEFVSWEQRGWWNYQPSVDRERARAFFSRLSSVKYWLNEMHAEEFGCPALLDTAHQQLRRIWLPSEIPDTIAKQFFARCSDALTVVHMYSLKSLSQPTLELFAAQCTGLKALHLRCVEWDFDKDGFETMMKLRGPELVALHLGFIPCAHYIEPCLIPSIVKHCPSLEYLSICLALDTFRDGPIDHYILDLFRHCGGPMRYLCVNVLDGYHSFTKTSLADFVLIRAIAEHCPNLHGLVFRLGVRREMSEVGEHALERLLEKCKHLRTLDLSNHLDLNEISNVDLRVKLTSLKGGPKIETAFKRYFNWKTYAVPSSLDNQ